MVSYKRHRPHTASNRTRDKSLENIKVPRSYTDEVASQLQIKEKQIQHKIRLNKAIQIRKQISNAPKLKAFWFATNDENKQMHVPVNQAACT